MKIKLFILFILISIKMNCQLEDMGKFNTRKVIDGVTLYKIKGKIYETDYDNFFSFEKRILFSKKTDDILNFMLYKRRYLFIGYYPNTREQQMSSVGYELRLLRRLDIIDLEDSSKKWVYQFDKKTTMRNIKSFDPKDGDIVYCNHIKPEPELEKDSIK